MAEVARGAAFGIPFGLAFCLFLKLTERVGDRFSLWRGEGGFWSFAWSIANFLGMVSIVFGGAVIYNHFFHPENYLAGKLHLPALESGPYFLVSLCVGLLPNRRFVDAPLHRWWARGRGRK